MTMTNADWRRQIRYAAGRRLDPTLCRTNGCATRLIPIGDGRLRCPICALIVPAPRRVQVPA